jgi:hypothetical protein
MILKIFLRKTYFNISLEIVYLIQLRQVPWVLLVAYLFLKSIQIRFII